MLPRRLTDDEIEALRPGIALRRSVIGALERDAFRGVPLAPVVDPLLLGACRTGALSRGGKQPSANLATVVLHLFGSEWRRRLAGRSRRWPTRLVAGRVALEVTSLDEKLRGFWQPVALELGPEQCMLVLADPRASSSEWDRYPRVVVSDVPIDWPSCRRFILSRIMRWRRDLAAALEPHGFGGRAAWLIVSMLIRQTVRLAEADTIADKAKPRAFLTAWDRGRNGAPLCAMMRARGVSTITMVHGAVGYTSMVDFAPPIAEYVLAWGMAQKRLFTDAGVEGDRVLVTGCQRIGVDLARVEACWCEKRDRRRKGAPPVVLVAFTLLTRDRRSVWLDCVHRLVSSMPEAQFTFRLHPSSRLAEYRPLIQEGARVRLSGEGDVEREEALAQADVVIVDSSTIGLDALAFGCVVGVLDPYQSPIRRFALTEMLEAGAALYDTDSHGMAERLRTALGSDERLEALQAASRRFLSDYVGATGKDAARNVARAVQAVARG